ncbi:MAG TPA: response regulator [Anaeromyxobacteraceae bacterium]|jgi:two-component system chemotaxis sensor kinase CheA|nr:response regulator [Anaeromyxobacteraceae bacterium]
MARDRYKYFRIEARELLEGLSRGLLDLERAPADAELLARLLRLAHTLKGAARVVQQQAIGELAHRAEEALAPHREPGSAPVSREEVDLLLRLLDRISAEVSALEQPAPQAVDRPAPAPAEPAADGFESVRVDVRELDVLLASVVESAVQVGALRRQLSRLDHVREVARALQSQLAAPRAEAAGQVAVSRRAAPLLQELRRALGEAHQHLATRADQAERELGQLRTSADRLRLLPSRALFGPLERAVRDAARLLDRQVRFEVAGGEVRVEANVLAAVRDALLHVVRNAVAHGTEPVSARHARGLPAAGCVRLEVERRGSRVAFTCRDDGPGLDLERLRAAAARKGLIPAGAPLDEPAAVALLLRGGLSTSPGVDDVSGRGVGLDVVRDVAARLKADLALRSEPGWGLVVELCVPVSLTAMTALLLQAGGATVALPLEAVTQSIYLSPERVARRGAGEGISHGGELIPFLPLGRALRQPEPAAQRRAWSAVVVRAPGGLLAVGADRLLGTAEVVVRPLSPWLEAEPSIAGASLDAEGTPQLVLEPAGLLAAAEADRSGTETDKAEPAPPILVVDDSLTTRMLEQSILESAGYEVELAVSAEEALEKAHQRRYGLFVVDVEMPGMDGFEFVRTTRADPRTAATPAILVTSRSAEEDRRRGAAAGASAYVVKGEFDQGRLLELIEELLA